MLQCGTFFLINNKTSLNENNQLQRAEAHRKCAEVNMKTNETKMHESTTIFFKSKKDVYSKNY